MLREYGTPLEVVDVTMPTELEPGALLVQVSAATVCGTDVHRVDRPSQTGKSELPRIVGHEMTGRIVAMGEGVTHDSVRAPIGLGDRIVWSHGFCGSCEPCVVYGQPTLCEAAVYYGMPALTRPPYLTGAFSQYCYVFPTSGRIRVPDEISDGLASASSCALRTVMQAFDRLGLLDERHTVVIQGSGPLGLFSVARAIAGGAAKVIVIGGPRARLAIARSWGATATIDIDEEPDAEARAQQVDELTDGRGADVVVEMTGSPAAFGEGMRLLRSGGRYLVVGIVDDGSIALRPSQIVSKQATIIGSVSADIAYYYRALRFLQIHRGRFDWDELLSTRYELDDINDALDAMRTGAQIKPVITFG